MWKFCLTPLNGSEKKANRRKIVPKIKQIKQIKPGGM